MLKGGNWNCIHAVFLRLSGDNLNFEPHSGGAAACWHGYAQEDPNLHMGDVSRSPAERSKPIYCMPVDVAFYVHIIVWSWAQATTIFKTRPNHPQTTFNSQARESSRFFLKTAARWELVWSHARQKRYRKSHRIKMSSDESTSYYVWHVMTYKCTETSWLFGCDSSTSIARIGAFDPNSAWYFDQGRAA